MGGYAEKSVSSKRRGEAFRGELIDHHCFRYIALPIRAQQMLEPSKITPCCSLPVERLGRIAWIRRRLGHQHGVGDLNGLAGFFLAVCHQGRTQAAPLHVLELPHFLAVFVAPRELTLPADIEVHQE